MPKSGRVRVLEVPLPGRRVLRLALALDSHGEPQELALTAGFPGSHALDFRAAVVFPASDLPALRDALSELETA